MIKSRIGGDTLYERANVEIVEQKVEIDFEEETKSLPYRFVDVHKIDVSFRSAAGTIISQISPTFLIQNQQ